MHIDSIRIAFMLPYRHACYAAGSSSASGTATRSCARAAAARTRPRTARRRASGRPSRRRTQPRPRSACTGRASMQPAAAQAAKGVGASEVARSRPCVGRQRASCKVMHDSSPIANLQRTRVQARWVAGNGSEGGWAATLVSQGKWGAGRRAAQAQQCGLAAAVPCTSGRAESEPVSVKPLPRWQV